MGYNNNNAGMHMMWYKEYLKYENADSYYDMVILNNLKKEKERMDREKTKLEKAKKKRNKNIKKENELEVKSIKGNRNEKKNKKNEEIIEYEDIVDKKLFEKCDFITRNIIFMALKNKKDISLIVMEAEMLMDNDKTLNTYWKEAPLLYRGMVFLSIVAGKIGCNVQEFFKNKKGAIKKYIYEMIDIIEDEDWYYSGKGSINERTGEMEITFEMDFKEEECSIKRNYYDKTKITMCKVLSEKQYIYTFSYGYDQVDWRHFIGECKNNFMFRSECLYEEDEGKLKELMERLINRRDIYIERYIE